MKHKNTALAALLLLLPMVTQNTVANEDTDAWQFQLTPYVWIPTISGNLNYDIPPSGGGAPKIKVGPTDWLELLNGAFLMQFEARKSGFVLLTDIVYLGLESDNDKVISVSASPSARIPVNVNRKTETDIDGFTATFAGGYAFRDDDQASLDVFAGARFFSVDTKTSWNLTAEVELPGGGSILSRQGSIESDLDSWDGIAGIKGHRRIGNSKWALNYYLDAGTGDSDLTWQAIAGASYTYGWGDLLVSYRHFEYDGGPRGLMEDFSFSGLVIGGRFSF